MTLAFITKSNTIVSEIYEMKIVCVSLSFWFLLSIVKKGENIVYIKNIKKEVEGIEFFKVFFLLIKRLLDKKQWG